ncbi:MAG: hypothetical protein GF315_01110 [candidate division Zixibacteria bacterium]|nr:hypothetical protein [candidate division Zixibacteria bacterium]
MDIQKLTEIAKLKEYIEISGFLNSGLYYIDLIADRVQDLFTETSDSSKLYRAAIIALLITSPIIIIKKLVQFTLKLIIPTAIAVIALGYVYPLPPVQHLTASVLIGLTIMFIVGRKNK